MGDSPVSKRLPARVGLVAILVALLATVTPASLTARGQGEVMFGASPGGSSDRRAALEGFEAEVGRTLDLVRVFERWDSAFPTAYHQDVLAEDRLMLLSVRPIRQNGSFLSWRQIADAQPGTAIHQEMVEWVEAVIDLGTPVWFSFNHEPEIVANQANGDADDFMAAWRRIVAEFRSRGGDQVEFVWIMTDHSFHVPPSDRRHAAHWYPGDDVVDHIAADAYNWSDCRVGIHNPWKTLEEIIDPLRVFGQAHPGKGLVLAEWASTEGVAGAKAAFIEDAADLLQAPGWEQFVAVSYFDHVDQGAPGCEWPVDSSPSSLDAIQAMAADPFYGGGAGAPEPPEPPEPPDPSVLLAGTADATGGAGTRWHSVTFTPTEDGIHQLLLDWEGEGMLRTDLRVADSGAWVAANIGGDKPKAMEASLEAGRTYRLAVWAFSGVGSFTVSHQAPDDGGGPGEPPPDDPGAPAGIFSGTVDADGDKASRWVSTTWTPTVSGSHDLALDWTGDGDLRIDVRLASSGQWVDGNTGTARPKLLDVEVEAGTAYQVAVWSMAGTGTFELEALSP